MRLGFLIVFIAISMQADSQLWESRKAIFDSYGTEYESGYMEDGMVEYYQFKFGEPDTNKIYDVDSIKTFYFLVPGSNNPDACIGVDLSLRIDHYDAYIESLQQNFFQNEDGIWIDIENEEAYDWNFNNFGVTITKFPLSFLKPE